MKKHKLISLSLSGILLLTSLSAGCSKENKDSAPSQTPESTEASDRSEDTENTDPTDSEVPTLDYISTLNDFPDSYWESLNYGDDFTGKVKIGNRDDLYTDSPDIKAGFVASDEYGCIFPYVDKRELTDVINADTSNGDMGSSEFSAGCSNTYDYGFCTADGTRITEPIYEDIIIMSTESNQTILTEDFSGALGYAVWDKNDKFAVVSLDGSKATDFCYDTVNYSTDLHSDWIFCYQYDENAQTTVITVYNKDLEQVMEPITLDFIIKSYFPDGYSINSGITDILDDKHILITDNTGDFDGNCPGYVYNLETQGKFTADKFIPLNGDSLIVLKEGRWFISNYDGKHLTELFGYCLNTDIIGDYAFFSNDPGFNKTSIFDKDGNLINTVNTAATE